jgi:NAD(P)-dependent dehydrogenase (short-subunit alcohol dehydrogenase family)
VGNGTGVLRFDGRVAIVTGAGAGLGREHALLLAGRGAQVLVNDLSEQRALDVVAEIIGAGGVAVADSHRIGDARNAEAIVEHALDSFGRLDIVLNNAGSGGPTGEIDTVDEAMIERIIGTHLVGTIYVNRAAWRHLAEAGYGRILNTSSGSALGAAGGPIYSAAKAGLIGLTRALAVEGVAHGINVNALLPMGYTRGASLNPDEKVRSWMESAFPARLASPAAIWLLHHDCAVTGELLMTGGGRVARVGTVSVPGIQMGMELTAEDVRDNWSTISELTDGNGVTIVRHTRDDMALFTGEQTWPGS